MTEDDVRGVLAPYHARLATLIHEAFAEWRAVEQFRAAEKFGPTLYDRTKSNYIFDAISRRAIPRFGVEERVSVDIEAQTFKLRFRGLVLRIKKGGDDELGQNHPTLSALAFIDADGVLPGLPPETMKIEVVWLPNEIWTAVESIYVTARDGSVALWRYEIRPALPTAEIIPIRPAPTGDRPATGLVKPKSTSSDSVEEQ
jgi:hypothetical protein